MKNVTPMMESRPVSNVNKFTKGMSGMQLSQLKKSGLALAVAGLMSLPTASMATLVNSSDPLNFSWSFDTGTSLLTGFGSMTLSGFNTDTLSVAVTLNNTSQLGGQGGERLTSFGFGIDPNATSISFADAADGGLIGASMSSIPSLATIDVCAYGGNNCSGGGGGGIWAGLSDTFTLLLGGTWGSSVNIEPIGFKYQTGAGSFEFTSSSSSSGALPEPASASLVGLGLGLLGFGFARRRKNDA
jgi:hypothetical protein